MKSIKRLTLCALFALCSLYASASDFVTDGIYYNVISSTDLTCEVTQKDNVYGYYTGSISIPETVTRSSNGNTYTVVGIGRNAFHESSRMTAVTIPTTVTYIDSLAFDYCSALTEITIPRTVTSIGGCAFRGCSALTEIEIPSGVDIIHTYTFYGCSNLEKVTIPSSVTSIWNYAFSGCSCLSDVTIPSSVTSIGDRAFYNCSKLATVTLEDGEETLAMTTSSSYTPFSNCSAINTLYLGRNISYTGSYSPFREKTTLSELTIGNYVTSLGTYEFYGCTALENFDFPNSVTDIGTYAFYNCSNLSELTIPDNVTTIGSYAFYGCSGLKEISVGSGVTSLGSYAFYNCKPEEMYFFARLSDYYLVFNGLTCGTLYAHEDQIDAIKAEYSGTVLPLEDVYTLSAEGVYPRSIALRANVNEKLLVDGVSLKSVTVGRNELTAGADGLYIAKNLIPNQTYTCTLTFMYGTEERTDVLEITTENFYDEPTLQSTTPTSITYAIKLKEDAYSSLPDEYGLMYDGKYYAADEDGKATVTGLTGNTEYTFDLYATYDGSTIKGESVTATTLSLTAPTVTTSSATDITATSASLNGSVTAGNEEILEQGFEYWVTEDNIQAVIATDGLSVTLTELTPGTTYNYRAYVKTDSGTFYGGEMTFATLVIDPTVQTVSATNVTASSATLTATITPGSEEIEEQGFEYRPSSASSSEVQTIVGDGEEMIVTLTGLSSNTTYIYCAYAKTASKTTYGEEKAFTTSIFVAPTVQTNAATNITTTSATLNGSYTAGSEEILEQGFEYWATSGNDTDTHTTLADENMSATVVDLTPSMMYIYRAYVKTESGTTYGSAMSFTTEAEVIVPPTVQTFEATQITTNSAQLVGYITAGSEEVLEVGFEYWLSASDIQTIMATGEYISVVVEGLESNSTYTYRAYAKTESTTTYGDSMMFTTLYDSKSAYEDLLAEIEDAKAKLESVWTTITTDYSDVADEFKDEYESLMNELDKLLEELEEAYKNGTLTEELADEIRQKLSEILDKIEQLLDNAKQRHEFPYDFFVDGIYYNITSSAASTVEAMYGLTSSPYSNIIIIPSIVTNENVTYTVTSVRDSRFSDDTLVSITLPSTITSIGTSSFSNCSSLTTIICEWDNPSNVSVSESSFEGIYHSATLYVPIGTIAAYQASAPWNLFDDIEEYDTMDGMINYNLSGNSASVASHQSTDLSGDIVIPENVISEGRIYKVTTLANYAFQNCAQLISIVLPKGIETISNYAFEGCNALEEISLPQNLTSIGSRAFQYCYALTNVDIPNTVTTISDHTFAHCTSLKEIIIPESVTSLGEAAFEGSYSLTHIELPNTLSEISSYLCKECTSLTNVDIPEGVKKIGYEAFRDCSSLTEINIPISVTSIDNYAFYGSTALSRIYSYNPEPPTCGTNVFYKVDTQTCILYVPEGAVSAYSTADVWKDFYDIIEMVEFSIETLAATDVTDTSATLNGSVIAAYNEPIIEKGFEYRTGSDNPTIVVVESDDMVYTLSYLTSSTTYTYRAYATMESGKEYGDEVEFTTLEVTGINGLNLDDPNIKGFYNLAGVRVNTPTKGNVYIILFIDGTTKKIMVK